MVEYLLLLIIIMMMMMRSVKHYSIQTCRVDLQWHNYSTSADSAVWGPDAVMGTSKLKSYN